MTKQVKIVLPEQGYHNSNPQTRDRLMKGRTYQDLSTVCVVPTRGMIHARVVQCWMNMLQPMNQKFMRVFMIGMEVGEAYNAAVEFILGHPDLSQWKYMLTLEEDNMPPPDGLLKLYEGMDRFDVVQGLYWTKGHGGQPMIYGNPAVMPKDFVPQLPQPDTLQACNGLGMGFNLFKIAIFKDERLKKPWFKTEQKYIPGVGVSSFTQDLYFFQNAGAYYKFACDTRIKVGHYDAGEDIVW